MCDYCYEEKGMTKHDFEGTDGVYHNKRDNKYYLVIYHFKNECNEIEVKYCPQCGRKLG